MTDGQIEDLANRFISAVERLSPGEPSGWVIMSSLAPVAALLAAILVTFIGWRNLKHQQAALAVSVQNDDRSEWWKRAQWALEAAVSPDNVQLAAAGSEMLTVLVDSDMASDDDKDLLDTAWRAGTGAVSQQAAVEALAEATAFVKEADLDDSAETSDNEGTKEDDHG